MKLEQESRVDYCRADRTRPDVSIILKENHSVRSMNMNCIVLQSIILPVVLYECETWSLTLRKERKLSV